MSLRERLLGRKAPQATVRIRVEFTPDADTAAQGVRDAEQALRVAEASGSTDRMESARAAVGIAQAGFDRYCETLTLHPLSPADLEALLDAHQPTGEQRERHPGLNWGPSFIPALLAACVDGDLTEDDWLVLASKGDQLASGEVSMLFQTALAVNDRGPELQVGKGSTQTPS